MLIVLLLLVLIYGGLTVLASVVQFKQKKINLWANLLMLFGSVLIIVSAIFEHTLQSKTIYLLVTGLISIHIAAIDNGYKMYGKINFKHHIIRLIISILIIVLYEMGK